MDWTRFNKAIGSAVGALVTVAVAWLATKTPLAECVVAEGKKACSFLGLSTIELTAILAPIVVGGITAIWPANTLTPMEAIKQVEQARDQDGTKVVQKVELNPQSREASKINVATGSTVTVGPSSGTKP